ncbi:sensor histidine kinase [Actimicrobium antarcticum]|uniref:histidine kinase n=1 Tax=Actimicrobium antarcticum TaxID=1051899 RepID=A0ABP7T618_9BURK
MQRALRYALVVGGAIVAILLFLLASASDNSASFDKHYPWLLGLNAMVTIALLGLVALLLARLYARHKRGMFGSRLMSKLVLLFAAIGILPGLVIYTVSVQFVSRSIESWFDVRVEAALESGLNLGRAALDASLSDLSTKAHNLAVELSDLPDSGQIRQLARWREQNGTQEAIIVSISGRIIATDGGELKTLVPDMPTPSMLRQAKLSRGYTGIEGQPEPREIDTSAAKTTPPAVDAINNLRLRVVVAIPAGRNALSLQSEGRVLQLIQAVPSTLATNAEALRAAYSEYQERSLSRSGLRKIYIVTLTLTLLLAIFAAIVSAFLIATDLAEPLLLLAEGTKAVAEGDLSPRPIVATSDELGTLTQSFNTMTRQLFDARAAVEINRSELENAKAYLESVLANMSAGVMVLDDDFRLITCNESVERILQQDIEPYLNQPLSAIDGLLPFFDAIRGAFSAQSAQSAGTDNGETGLHWQQQIEVPRRGSDANRDDDITLLARGSRLPVAKGTGYVVVFDNISEVISAQRSIAWGEVARRLAHEIKNPLTPIQLSAERLQMKLEDKLMPLDAAMLNKSTATIVNQVTAMKRMVDDFRDYAKTPPAVLSPLNLNALVEEVLHLYTGGDERATINAVLSRDLPLVMGDTTQLRQVIHNLLQNAQDAVADRPAGSPAARIDVLTEAIHYQSANGKTRRAVRLTITDNGPGFASKILKRAFEPYVTSKPRGTGLGLAMVKKIVDEHGGRIDILNRSDTNGTKILILLLKLAPGEQPEVDGEMAPQKDSSLKTI